MTLVIHPGWWLLPLAITALVFGWAIRETPKASGGYGDIAGLLSFGGALIVSLVAWLAWAVL